MKPTTLFAIYLLDFVLPQVSKLSKCLQTEKLDLSVISSLVDAILHTLDDVLLPAANWVLELQDVNDEMKNSLGLIYSYDDVVKFQNETVRPFYCLLKENIQNRFSSQDIVASFSIFDPKMYKKSPSDTYGDEKIKTLLDHYGRDLPAKTVIGEQFTMPPTIPSDLSIEWKSFRRYLTKQLKDDLSQQLKELATSDMLQIMCPGLSTLAKICMTIPVKTASVERSFSQMKMIKTCLRNRLGEDNLSNLMKIAIESPESLADEDLEQIIDVWNEKPRRLIV